jgi:outer membrane protein W
MRRHIAVVMLLLSLFAVCAVAQEKTDDLQKGTFRVFGFGSNFGFTESDVSGSNWHGGFGLGLEYRFSDRWSTEMSVSRDRSPVWTFGTLGPGGELQTQRFRITSHPVDVMGQYHFSNRSAWKPFVGAGLRYVSETGPGFPYEGEDARLSPQLAAGFYYNITRQLGLRVDVKRLLASDSTLFDDSRKVSVGLGWSF